MTTVEEIIPLDPADLWAAAGRADERASQCEDLADSVEKLPEHTPHWEGHGRTGFEIRVGVIANRLRALGEIYTNANSLLKTAAEIFSEYRGHARDLIAQEVIFADDPANLALVQEEIAELKTAGKTVATQAGTELAGLLDGYEKTAEATGGEESDKEALQPVELSREENLRLYAMLQGEGAMNYGEVIQGRIGNCYLLADIIALMSSDKGADFLRNSIQPIFSAEDNEIIGWKVRTFEPDHPLNPFDSDQESWQVVTERYAKGSHGNPSGETLSWLLERAYGQMIGHDEAEGGLRDVAFEHLMGQDATVIEGASAADWKFWDEQGYSAAERQKIIEAIENQQPVAAGTGAMPKDNGYWQPIGNHRDGGHESYVEVNVGGPAGRVESIRIFGAHAYALVAADDHGVTLVNPHGTNTIEKTGEETENGQFYISWEEFERRFGNIAVGAELP